MSSKRIADYGMIDRSVPLEFSWDGQGQSGYQGDTLASALLANGHSIIGRSFKYHRPRGVMSAGTEESGAMVTVGKDEGSKTRRDPNVKATTQELFAGLTATGQNAWPNVRMDFGAVSGLFGRFFAAGFYYKTFMGVPPFESFSKGTGIWMQYEKIIRRAAGLGESSRLPDADHYEHGHLHCDVLVVGAGPAGMHAALSAAQAGLEVILTEQDFELGGDWLNQGDTAQHKKRVDLIKELEKVGVRIMTRTTTFGLYDYGVAGLLERVTDHLSKPSEHLPRQRFWTLRAQHTILATGAMERQFAFGNNDRPGVMNAHAARTYLNRYGVLCGQNAVVATTNDGAYTVASDLAQAGAQVKVLDTRSDVDGAVLDRARKNNIDVLLSSTAMQTLGRNNVMGVEIANRAVGGGDWRAAGREQCDLLLVSAGWSPVVNLASHRGERPVWDAVEGCFVLPENLNDPITVAGSAAGVWSDTACVSSGRAAGKAAAKAIELALAGKKPRKKTAKKVDAKAAAKAEHLYEVKVAGRKLKGFVDPQHDVTCEDVRLAHREGFVSVEHLKRYTTLGMATDQGKMGNIIGLALMAEALGREIPEVGTTTFRPPYTPISVGALAGRSFGAHFRPLRRTAMHDWNLEHGAKMMEVGLWQRPWYFPQGGEGISEAYVRETIVVRESVGLCDVTSLGKIAVQGPDSAKFLNRVYTNAFAKLAPGKARYGIMLRDDGMVMDDGTTWCLGEGEYFMTTTTAHAAKVMVWLEELLQTRWPELKVHVSSVSEQWAGCAIAGPKSRAVLEKVLANSDEISNDHCPFMGVIESTLENGVPCRIARISFSGEMAYEMYVPSDYAASMMDSLWVAAQSFDGCLYGLETLGALRIEKGHVTGAELDGRVTIEDAGLGGMASTKKSYIGNVLRKRPAMQAEGRPQLVGIFPKNKDNKFKAGALLHAVDANVGDPNCMGDGWVTGVTHSPTIGHWIGVGFLAGGYKAWEGKTLICADPVRQGDVEVEVVSPHMVDPSGNRMKG